VGELADVIALCSQAHIAQDPGLAGAVWGGGGGRGGGGGGLRWRPRNPQHVQAIRPPRMLCAPPRASLPATWRCDGRRRGAVPLASSTV
jgi:hypothetical protein